MFATPDVSYGHTLTTSRGVLARRDLDATADELGDDARTWRRLMRPLVDRIDDVVDFTGSNLLFEIQTGGFEQLEIAFDAPSPVVPQRQGARLHLAWCIRQQVPDCQDFTLCRADFRDDQPQIKRRTMDPGLFPATLDLP